MGSSHLDYLEIKITDIQPDNKKYWKNVHFTVLDDDVPYEFCYNTKNPKESYFSDTPEEIEDSYDAEAVNYLIKLVKNYEIKGQLSSNTVKTFGDLIDEL